MLKKYKNSGTSLSEKQLQNIQGGSTSGESLFCSVNDDCGFPACASPTDVNCWVCIHYHGTSFCSWFEA